MKQLLILLISLVYAWGAFALEEDEELRNLRTRSGGRGTRYVCIDTGKRTGMQTLEVPANMAGFFKSRRRNDPAEVRRSCVADSQFVRSNIYRSYLHDTLSIHLGGQM